MAFVDLLPSGYANTAGAIVSENPPREHIIEQIVDFSKTSVVATNVLQVARVPPYHVVKSFMVDVQKVEGGTLTVQAGLYAINGGAALSASNTMLTSTDCNGSVGPVLAAGTQISTPAISATAYDIGVLVNNTPDTAILRFRAHLEDMRDLSGTVPESGAAQ